MNFLGTFCVLMSRFTLNIWTIQVKQRSFKKVTSWKVEITKEDRGCFGSVEEKSIVNKLH